ncbi:variant erythrocyte surface antigen-1 family protein [Babesia caballi]|uniref:Variant erythrocyte surface antigen-1 family protein n=1 Tax=Babesia caballi TaxID=5871 RepID=A0AAV4LMY1_BABCB|nr:variant erythrocyte surface antigen-1 family protein [Babesia caballi]
MTTGKKNLTQPPESLKSAVDWVLGMSGNDVGGNYQKGLEAIQTLAQRIQSLLGAVRVGSVDVNTLLQGDLKQQSTSKAPITSLGLGLKALIEQGNGMGRDYKCSYSDSDPSKSIDEKSANILLGTIPLLFFGLGFLFWKCRNGWGNLTLSSGPLKDFLFNVGFNAEQLNGDKNGSKVANMFSSFDEFRNSDSSPKTYHEFLQKVGEQTKKELQNVNHVPLGALYLFTYQYLKKHKSATLTTTDDGIPTNENDLTALLQKLGDAVKDSKLGSLTKLSSAYTQLSTAITTAINTPNPVEESSVAGPVTGTLVTAGLLGGGSAVYFNVAGLGTFLKGILRIP